MRLPAWAWLVIGSMCLAPLAAETRPRYGGTLTVEDIAIPTTETLVRINSRGGVEPVLAVAWQNDPDFKRWRFSLRTKVVYHDGEPFTAASAVPSLLAALKPRHPDVVVEAGGQALLIKSSQPMPDLLQELALPDAVIARMGTIGTGPFRAQGSAFTAFEEYWGGRPYLDTVLLQDAAARGRADLFDVPAGPQRRILPEGWITWSSAPRTLVALQGLHTDPNLLNALGAAIDRAPIAEVLAQHKAEPAFGLLPQWLSGYEFLFHNEPAAFKITAPPVSLGYPANNPFLRSVAERIALNARDAGIVIQLKSSGDLQLIELPLASLDAAYDLERLAAQLKAGPPATALDRGKPESLFAFERALIEDAHVIPLVHLRKTYAISPKVHIHSSPDQFSLDLENAWIEESSELSN